ASYCFLGKCSSRHRMDQLLMDPAVFVFSWGDPAYPVPGRQGFGYGAAPEHQVFRIVILAGAGSGAAKVKIPVNIVFYQRYAPLRKHVYDLPFMFVGHTATQRIVEVAHQYAGDRKSTRLNSSHVK